MVNDARSFLRQTDERFDTVIYGLLDSHTNLGAMTNVRLDSFVYTVEGFRDAVRRLSDRGLLVVSYLVLDPRQGDKLFLVTTANRMALCGIACLMLAMTGILSLLSGHLFGWVAGAVVAVGAAALLGGLWFGIGLTRRRHLARG